MLHSVHVSRTTTWIRPTRSAYGGGESERDIRASETPERREERLRVRRERDRARRAIRVANATADATQGPPAAVTVFTLLKTLSVSRRSLIVDAPSDVLKEIVAALY